MGIIKKTITYGVVGVAAMAFIGGVMSDPNSPEIQEAHLKECQSKYGAKFVERVNEYSAEAKCYLTEDYKSPEQLAEEKKQAEKDAKLAAYKASPKGKTEEFMKWTATGHCKNYTKASAKFPTKVDFDWGVDRNFWMDFNDKGDARVMIQFTGEMMNGLGLMVPFKSTCKYDYNPETGKSTIIEFLL